MGVIKMLNLNDYTKDELKVIADIFIHKNKISNILSTLMNSMIYRSKFHDSSKLSDEELPRYLSVIPELSKCKYGSEEYDEVKKHLGKALEHHYLFNNHHMEYFNNTITISNGMNLLDLLEMISDWIASASRNAKSKEDILNSIQLNINKYKFSTDLSTLIISTTNFILKTYVWNE